MAMATFDTLKFANALKAVGVPDKQAEAEAQVLSEVFSINFREVTTKEDLKRAVADIEVKIREVEQRLLVKIDQNKNDLTAKIDQFRLELNARIDQVKTELSAKIDFVEKKLDAKIDQVKTELSAKMDSNQLKLSGEMILLRWMFGVVISFLVAMLALLIRVYLSTKPN